MYIRSTARCSCHLAYSLGLLRYIECVVLQGQEQRSDATSNMHIQERVVIRCAQVVAFMICFLIVTLAMPLLLKQKFGAESITTLSRLSVFVAMSSALCKDRGIDPVEHFVDSRVCILESLGVQFNIIRNAVRMIVGNLGMIWGGLLRPGTLFW